MFEFLRKKLKKVLRAAKGDPTPELETTLLEAGVSLEVVDRLITDVKEADDPKAALRQSLLNAMEPARIKVTEKPFIIMLVGINGTGKTTVLAKLAHRFQDGGKTVIAAAGDTFRAAAIEQLGEHCRRLDVPLVKQRYGADPAAVAYDAVESARARGADVVLIDTSGRLHVDSGLMKELEKVKRVASPHLSLLVVDATTGNDAVEQARAFAPLIDGFVITKVDVDERGGAVVSVSAATGKPIYFIGTGQDYGDLEEFSPKKVVRALGL
jgi:fused signal recognition particle receptor